MHGLPLPTCIMTSKPICYCTDVNTTGATSGAGVILNIVRGEIVFALTIVSYDKVRGRNKPQRRLRSVCVRFFITDITQPDTI